MTVDKLASIEQTLSRAAECIGDITRPVLDRYYGRCPEGRAAFDAHALINCSWLEGQMVENSLHCLLRWFECPGEIEILLLGSVLHHNDTLDIPPHLYRDLIDATAEVIADTIPSENVVEREVWMTLRSELRELVDSCGKWTRTARADAAVC
jgi:hypothetical protein